MRGRRITVLGMMRLFAGTARATRPSLIRWPAKLAASKGPLYAIDDVRLVRP